MPPATQDKDADTAAAPAKRLLPLGRGLSVPPGAAPRSDVPSVRYDLAVSGTGERFDMGAMTAAHKTLPFNTRVCVRSLVNGSEVLVRVNDRGPFTPGRIIDLSRAAADRIGLTSMGIKQVALSVIDREGMRCGGQAVAADDLQPALLPEAPTSRVRAPAPARKRAAVPPRKRR
jgi:rare lipoprotein A